MTSFKNRLKELRTKRGLSQRALADDLHISKSAVSMYENGTREPDHETTELIADYFNVDVDYLLGRKDYTMQYVKVQPDGQSGEYYEDVTVQKIAETMRTNPESRIVFDAMSDLGPEDLKVIAKLVKKKSD